MWEIMANLMPLYAVHCENSIFISFCGFGALFEFSEQAFACPGCISLLVLHFRFAPSSLIFHRSNRREICPQLTVRKPFVVAINHLRNQISKDQTFSSFRFITSC